MNAANAILNYFKVKGETYYYSFFEKYNFIVNFV